MCRKKRERSAERLSQTCSGVGRIRIAVSVGFRQDLPVERLIVRLTFLHAPRRKTAAFSFFHTVHEGSVNMRHLSGNTPQTAPAPAPPLQSLQSVPLPVHSAPPPVHLSPYNIPDIPNQFLLTNNKSRAIAGFVLPYENVSHARTQIHPDYG